MASNDQNCADGKPVDCAVFEQQLEAARTLLCMQQPAAECLRAIRAERKDHEGEPRQCIPTSTPALKDQRRRGFQFHTTTDSILWISHIMLHRHGASTSHLVPFLAPPPVPLSSSAALPLPVPPAEHCNMATGLGMRRPMCSSSENRTI